MKNRDLQPDLRTITQVPGRDSILLTVTDICGTPWSTLVERPEEHSGALTRKEVRAAWEGHYYWSTDESEFTGVGVQFNRREIEIASLAGLFDGEGSVAAPSRALNVASADWQVLEILRRLFGGNIYKNLREARKSAKKIHWRWRVSGENVAGAAAALMPHCNMKGRSLRLLLELVAIVQMGRMPACLRTIRRRASLENRLHLLSAKPGRYGGRNRKGYEAASWIFSGLSGPIHAL